MRYFLLTVVLVLLACYLLTGVTIVKPGELAVVRRFGKILPERPRPGLHIGLPWGIDRVDRVAVEAPRRVLVGFEADDPDATGPTLPPGQLLTGDENLVNVLLAIDYKVDENHIENYIIQADRIDGLVSRATETALADWMAGREVDGVLLHDKAKLPAWLAKEVEARLAPYKLGIRIQAANIQELVPPKQVRDKFAEVNQAPAVRDQAIEKAGADSKQLKENARNHALTVKQATTAKVNETIKLAEADRDQFADRLEKNKQMLSTNRAALFNSIWADEMLPLFDQLKANGRIQVLDDKLIGEGLDLTTFAPAPKKE